jgi:CRISPR-associated protein, csm1 family
VNAKQIEVILGGLFHDIGNILYTHNVGISNCEEGYRFIKDAGIDNESILEQLKFQQYNILKEANIAEDSLVYITCWANSIVSRRSPEEHSKNTEEKKNISNKAVPLQSVFNIINGNNERKVYELEQVKENGEINFPVDNTINNSEEKYESIINNLKSGIKKFELTGEYINSLLSLLEGELTYVSSASDINQLADISLYDQMKITAAIGSCVYQYLESKEIKSYKKALMEDSSKAYNEDYFLMFSMDISGIQSFIYKVDSSEALKSLRSKSLYLEIMLEHIIDELLEAVNLSRANLIYSGGGHAYILLPNTDEVIEKIKIFKAELKKWFIDNYGIDLYVAMGYKPCSANTLKNSPKGSYENLFKEVSKALSNEKISRYSANEIRRMNSFRNEESTRECKVCGRVDHLTDEDICEYCNSFKRISRDILNKSFGFVTVVEEKDKVKNCIKLPFDKYMLMEDEESLKHRAYTNESGYVRSYSKNKMYTGVNVATRLWVGDYSSESSFEALAKASTGIDKLGVLRADVDNLGKTFISGFKPEHTSLSRTASFSRKLSMFFKFHINNILENGEYMIDGSVSAKRNVTIVYSGGDDVFIVGAWDDVIGLAIDLSDSLKKYSQGTLTISAGIGIFPKKFPVKAIARQTGLLEEASKSVQDKNAVTLFEDAYNQDYKHEFDCGEQTYKWDVFKSRVMGEKYVLIDSFFSDDDEKGMAAIYKLLRYIRNLDDKINLARLAYLLGRMQANIKDADENEEKYKVFSKQLYEWISNDPKGENRRELITAIYIYVYLHRKDEE